MKNPLPFLLSLLSRLFSRGRPRVETRRIQKTARLQAPPSDWSLHPRSDEVTFLPCDSIDRFHPALLRHLQNGGSPMAAVELNRHSSSGPCLPPVRPAPYLGRIPVAAACAALHSAYDGSNIPETAKKLAATLCLIASSGGDLNHFERDRRATLKTTGLASVFGPPSHTVEFASMALRPPLHVIVGYDRGLCLGSEAVRLACLAGCDPNGLDAMGARPLSLASSDDDPSLFLSLLASGANPFLPPVSIRGSIANLDWGLSSSVIASVGSDFPNLLSQCAAIAFNTGKPAPKLARLIVSLLEASAIDAASLEAMESCEQTKPCATPSGRSEGSAKSI